MKLLSHYVSQCVAAAGAIMLSLSAAAGPLADYNLIVFEDLNPSGSLHVHGRTFVGGDLYGANPEFGHDLNRSLTLETVEVAGDINASGWMKVFAGSVAYGGNISGGLSGLECHGNGYSSSNCASQVSGLDVKADDLYSQLKAESNHYASLAATGTTSAGKLSYGGGDATAVFHIDGADLFSSNWALDIGAATYAVINVSGSVLENGGGTNLDWTFGNYSNILWNFYEASLLNVATQWKGSVLAVDAIFKTFNDVEGSLAVKSYVGSGQVHVYPWTPTVEVPEPSMLLLLIGGLSLVILGRRTRRET